MLRERSLQCDTFGNFLASVNDLIEHALQDLSNSEIVGITNQKRVYQNDKATGISFRSKSQLAGDVKWKMFERIIITKPRTRWS